MKRFGILLIAGLMSFGTVACTNDEGDPEFEILNPQEENQEGNPAQKEKDPPSPEG